MQLCISQENEAIKRTKKISENQDCILKFDKEKFQSQTNPETTPLTRQKLKTLVFSLKVKVKICEKIIYKWLAWNTPKSFPFMSETR